MIDALYDDPCGDCPHRAECPHGRDYDACREDARADDADRFGL
jgi:hypothetical protein